MVTMTKQQKLNTLEAVEARAFAELENADPKQVEFNNILNNVGLLRHITEMVRFGDPELFTVPESELTVAIDPTPIKPVDAEIPPQPTPEPLVLGVTEPDDATPWEDKPNLTLEEVRKKLVPMYRAGLNLASLLQQVGADKLSDVPADKYAELLALAEKAFEEAN